MRKRLILGMAFLLQPACVLGNSLQADQAFATGDYATAYREWTSAAAAGDASAMAAVGMMYDTGNGVTQDFAAALQWYRRAAEAGHVRAMFNVGAMFDNGRGTPVSRTDALYWYERAATRRHGRAAYAAGVIYRDGDGVPRSRDAAIRFFRIAAELGIEAARPNLAALQVPAPPRSTGLAAATPGPVRTPPGTPALDPASLEIARIFKASLARAPLDRAAVATFTALVPTLVDQAAKNGRLAQYNVGYAFENGYGASRDPVRSYVYYLRATASPDADLKAAALRGATDIGRRLTAEQHASAREMLIDGTP